MKTIVSASLLVLGLSVIAMGFFKNGVTQTPLEMAQSQLAAAQVTIANQDKLSEGLIKGEGYTVTRQENTDTVRYLVGSCVKKEVQMFVPVGDK